MFVEIISLQYEKWIELMRVTQRLGECKGVPQIMYYRNHALHDYNGFDTNLSAYMGNGGGHVAYTCAQLFCLESQLNGKLGMNRISEFPLLVSGFWRMFELEFRGKPPTRFQVIPKIGLTIALDFGYESESVSMVRSLMEKYELEGETCVIPASVENWKEKVCAEVEKRFGSALEDYKDFLAFIGQPREPEDENISSDAIDEDVPF